MTYLDSALLNLTEAFCRRFQQLTGRTNVWLAFQLTNLSIVVYFVWAGLYFFTRHGITRTLVALLCGSVLYLLTQTIFKVPVESLEASAYSRVARGFRNPRRVRDAALRIAFLTVSILLFAPALFAFLYMGARVIVSLGYLLVVATTIVLYLLACDPLAPCAGRVSEWMRQRVPGLARNPARVTEG